MALTANREVQRYVDQELRGYALAAGAQVFKGAFVGLNGGYARGLVAADPFVGIAYEAMDNTGGAAGSKTVRVYTQGDFRLALAGAAVTNLGATVYASDDETLTLTASGNSPVGKIVGFEAAGVVIVRIG